MSDKTTRETFSEKLDDDEAMIALGTCACGNRSCQDLRIIIRNPRVEPNPEKTDELVCATKLPLEAIPGIVSALMQHYVAMTEDENG